MSFKCKIEECNSWQGRDKNISFHVMPSETALRKKWINQIETLNNQEFDGIPMVYRICGLHFSSKDFHMRGNNKCLKKGSLPTIFPRQGMCKSEESATVTLNTESQRLVEYNLSETGNISDAKSVPCSSSSKTAKDRFTSCSSYSLPNTSGGEASFHSSAGDYRSLLKKYLDLEIRSIRDKEIIDKLTERNTEKSAQIKRLMNEANYYKNRTQTLKEIVEELKTKSNIARCSRSFKRKFNLISSSIV